MELSVRSTPKQRYLHDPATNVEPSRTSQSKEIAGWTLPLEPLISTVDEMAGAPIREYNIIGNSETSIVLHVPQYSKTDIEIKERYTSADVPDEVIVKVFYDDFTFENEKRAGDVLRQEQGKCIPTFYGEVHVPPYSGRAIVMQYLAGETLEQKLLNDEKWVTENIDLIDSMAKKVVSTFLRYHICHGDIKASNCMLVSSPESTGKTIFFFIDLSEARECNKKPSRVVESREGKREGLVCQCTFFNVGETVNMISTLREKACNDKEVWETSWESSGKCMLDAWEKLAM